MQTIDSYAKQNHLRVILQGPPGSGKSCLALHFPKPYFIDLDVNLAGPIRFAKRMGAPLPVGFDTIDRDETGAIIPLAQRFSRLDKCLLEAQANPEIETIIIDSATNLVDVMMAETLRLQNKTAFTKQEWGFFFTYSKKLMHTLTSMRKHIVLTAHEKMKQKEDGSVIYPVKIGWPGQLGDVIGAFFTDVWRCEVDTKPDGLGVKHEFILRTMPDYQYSLKNSLGLPAKFKFDWKTISEALAK